MKKFLYFLPLILLALFSSPVFAQEEERIELSSRYPSLKGTAVATFEFDVDLRYEGKAPRVFELKAIPPSGWRASIQSGYERKEISSIRIDPGRAYPESVKVILTPPLWKLADPGEYLVVLEASSPPLKDRIELKAVITAKYEILLETPTGRLNVNATAGKDNFMSIILKNIGTGEIDKITFTSEKPTGWSITFKPDKVEALAPLQQTDIEVNIKPPAKTIAGDYMVTLKASNKEVFDSLDIRVTVLTPTIWGWVGVAIVVLVIAALSGIFLFLHRR